MLRELLTHSSLCFEFVELTFSKYKLNYRYYFSIAISKVTVFCNKKLNNTIYNVLKTDL